MFKHIIIIIILDVALLHSRRFWATCGSRLPRHGQHSRLTMPRRWASVVLGIRLGSHLHCYDTTLTISRRFQKHYIILLWWYGHPQHGCRYVGISYTQRTLCWINDDHPPKKVYAIIILGSHIVLYCYLIGFFFFFLL